MPQRSIILDAIKGGLVLAMVAYHACYVAVMFGLSDIELYTGFWWVFPRVVAAGFVMVSGWNLAAKKARGGTLRSFARRAGFLGLIALAISAATLPVLGKSFVFFGIIHLLALSSLLAWPLLGRPAAALVTGAACLAAGLALGKLRFDFPWLAGLGFRPAGLYPADYLPLLPWFAFAAFGAAARDLFSAKLASRNRPRPAAVRALAVVGRRSLVIYLAHLPLLYGLGWLLTLGRH